MKRGLDIWKEAAPSQRWIVGGAGLAAVLVVALTWFQMLSAAAGARDITRSLTNERRLTETGEALLNAVVTAEAAQRTFLLTGRIRALDEAVRATGLIPERMDAFADAANGNELPTSEADRIALLAAERVTVIDQTIALTRDGLRTDAIEIVVGGRGDYLTSQIRAGVHKLLRETDQRRDESRSARDRAELISIVLQIVLSLVGSVGLGVAVISALHGRLVMQRAADDLQQANALLTSARQDADEANATKSRFLAAASHDMRQPLHALSLYLASLERRVQTPDALRIVSAMNAAVRTMTRMFSALLDLARLEAGVLKPDPAPFKVHDLLASVTDQAREIDPARPERIRMVQTRLVAFSDIDLLEVIVRNLAVNAAKYAAGGRVLVGCRRTADEVSIQVHDTGPGIPEDQLQRMFGEFVRGETDRSVEGLGLGLSIVDRLSRLLGHEVEVRSIPGRGTVFTVTVPRTGGVSVAPELPDGGARIEGARILLVDDEPLVLDAMAGALADVGADVRAAATADAAVEAARSGVDLCILDLYLAGEIGIQVLERVEEALGERVRCLFVTGSTASDALQALRLSGRQWATKPVPSRELVRLAAEILSRPA